jgi:CRP-like cAMP-binding protein
LPLLADTRNNAAMGYVADGSMLAGSPLFAGLDAAAREDVAAASHLVRLQAGETLFEQDDPATAFYVLITGRVKIAQVTVEGHQLVIRYIAAGQVFGAVPLFTRTGYPASATGVVDSVAARWDLRATHRLLDCHPRILLNALTIVGQRLQELQNRIGSLRRSAWSSASHARCCDCSAARAGKLQPRARFRYHARTLRKRRARLCTRSAAS